MKIWKKNTSFTWKTLNLSNQFLVFHQFCWNYLKNMCSDKNSYFLLLMLNVLSFFWNFILKSEIFSTRNPNLQQWALRLIDKQRKIKFSSLKSCSYCPYGKLEFLIVKKNFEKIVKEIRGQSQEIQRLSVEAFESVSPSLITIICQLSRLHMTCVLESISQSWCQWKLIGQTRCKIRPYDTTYGWIIPLCIVWQ